jgi:hypothetical protein
VGLQGGDGNWVVNNDLDTSVEALDAYVDAVMQAELAAHRVAGSSRKVTRRRSYIAAARVHQSAQFHTRTDRVPV